MERIAILRVPEDIKRANITWQAAKLKRMRLYAIVSGICVGITASLAGGVAISRSIRGEYSIQVLPDGNTTVKIAGTKEGQKELLEDLVRDISVHDLVHFGEMHYYASYTQRETSTFEDFAELILPNLHNPKLTNNKPYSFIRNEMLYSDTDPDGKIVIVRANLDASGETEVGNDNTPAVVSLLCSPNYPKGELQSLRSVWQNGFRMRGLTPEYTKSARYKSNRLILKLREQYSHPLLRSQYKEAMSDLGFYFYYAYNPQLGPNIVTQSYLTTMRHDLQAGRKRMIIYGGAAHNDDNDPSGHGIADEMKEEYPGKYVSIDLVKPSLRKGEYTRYCGPDLKIVRDLGFDITNLESMVLIARQDDERADYILVLPKRSKTGLQN